MSKFLVRHLLRYKYLLVWHPDENIYKYNDTREKIWSTCKYKKNQNI
jgi:hypothetical protein